MMSLPRALALSFSQLGDPAILKVLGKSLMITLAIFLVLGWAASFGFEAFFVWAGMEGGGGAGALLAILATLIGAWLLFRFVALFVLQFFAEDVVRAVETRHYPQEAGNARSLALREEMANGIKSTTRAVLANIIALPFAALLLVTGIGTAILFWAVNAFLLGRELQDMVWLRHRQDETEIAPLGQGRRFVLGGAIAGLLMVPFLNLLAPVLGAASATHMVHRGRGGIA
ncbi:EI24 domain-containing protein [Qipengyuania sphaerica]|uniref:EI24 domain-containing protein n=1 Tax=Qipengyuania sphaerica TaxID=2867243 RepID=UPI001C87FE02|nr:EI24 domain-containing protein [Qipengyuania sphaerica]MBX7541578.1 EI24 domain-containing protein [Qipengyuania sphaerica]